MIQERLSVLLRLWALLALIIRVCGSCTLILKLSLGNDAWRKYEPFPCYFTNSCAVIGGFSSFLPVPVASPYTPGILNVAFSFLCHLYAYT